MTYSIKPLVDGHNRASFFCGKELLDNYIIKQAKQNMKRRLSVVFVMTTNDDDKDVIGYYTLTNDGINKEIVPEDIAKKMPPSYQNLPVTLLGRLVVDKNHQGEKLGEKLLIHALRSSSEASKTKMGSIAVVVDPLDKEAVSFYEQYGFILLPDRGRMFLPMKTIDQLF
ncbi:MAG: GNAT family N-acetyltransferase [Alphaproteobacteria bacterium]|nr:GNAT family N-acetyltransferase [Alphaproteobacteria bacterium]